MNEPFLRWKLENLLERENVTVYALNQRLAESGRSVSRTTLYRLASEQPERIDLEVAGRVLWGLEQLTGKRYVVSDLLEYDFSTDSKYEFPDGVPDDIRERIKRFEAGEVKLIPAKDIAAKYGVER